MDAVEAVEAVDALDTVDAVDAVDLFALTPTAYCILHISLHGFDLFALKVAVPTTHIC